MSWKGLTKSVSRAPQTFKQRFNIGEITKDAIYIDAERRFDELEKETKRLHEESKKYFQAINGMLTHQIEFSKAIADVYKPISGRMSDPDSFHSEGNQAGIQACEEYQAIVGELQETLKPELEMIETRVIKPADQLLEIIKAVRKMAVKRDHKQLDYDRHRAALKKLEDKKDKTLKDEKAMYRAEADVEQATQDYNYFNDLLKDELPKLFQLEREFIRPLFQSFYYMQLNVFYTLHERMQNIDIGYFDLTLDIEAAYEKKRGDVQSQAEAISIVKFKTTGGRKPGQGSKYASKALEAKSERRSTLSDGTETPPPDQGSQYASKALDGKPPQYSKYVSKALEAEAERAASGRNPGQGSRYASKALEAESEPRFTHSDGTDTPPPPYSPTQGAGALASPPGSATSWGSAAKSKGAAPPPPKPKPSRFSGVPAAQTCIALYDYEAQAEGDLSFITGDVIEIVTKTDNPNEWWIGKVRGKQGQFPGNYVRLN